MSETIEDALVRAQSNFKPVVKSKTNPHYKSTYADLGDVLAATVPALNAEGIAFVQPIENGELVTRLIKAGCTPIESRVPLNLDAKPQELGSQLTYLKRYCASALLGVASEEDDDGNAVSKARQERPSVNDDGEPLATKEQRDQFVAVCDALAMERKARGDYVKATVGRSAWTQVTRDDAADLIAILVRDNQLELIQDNAGKWVVVQAWSEPFEEPALPLDEPNPS